MAIPVRCACGLTLHADERHAGRTARCRCGRTVTIPATPAGKQGPAPTARRHRPATKPSLRGRGAALVAALRHRGPPLHWSERAAWGYLVLTLLIAGTLPIYGDRWLPFTAFLFGPRWVLLLPLLVLVPMALRRRPRRRTLALLGLGALVVLGPVMGWRFGWRGLFRGERDLRIVTYNVAGGQLVDLERALGVWSADVVALQECGAELASRIVATPGWRGHSYHQLCLLTRLPIVAADTFSGFRYDQGWGGLVTRYRLQSGTRTFTLVNLHFDTPRRGVEQIQAGAGLAALAASQQLRDDAMRHARRWLGPMPEPVVIAGDFNAPSESAIFRRHWSDFDDAFEETGRGYGGSRVLRRFRVRIDHLLSRGGLEPVGSHVGTDFGSDHRPVVADFAWE